MVSNHYQKYGKKWYEANKDSESLRGKTYYQQRGKLLKEAAYPARRRSILKSRYGITPEDFEEMLKKQDGRCAICGIQYHLTLHIDHDHTNGRVRGLLCNNCNRGLGHFKDSMDLLLKARSYLEKNTFAYPLGV